ncbi:MAG: zinc ribbon domain-containing protein [Christensenellales bacterium]
MQLDLLWEYMQVDMEAGQLENNMRRSPNRQKLMKNRNFILEQQKNLKKIEADFSAMGDRLAALQDECKRLDALVAEQVKSISENPAQDAEEAAKQIQSLQKLLETLTQYEQELSKLRRDAEGRDRQQREIRVRAAKAKAEYEAVREEYEVEFKRDQAELSRLHAKTQEEAAQLPSELLEIYNSIRKHVQPPIAELIGNQCGGCHMSVPSATVSKVELGEEIAECDNCGRILYKPAQ